jgi:Thioesterase-like superfamily
LDPSELPTAFFTAIGEGEYVSSPATGGPWSPHTQHGGPPAALLGRTLERYKPRPGFRIARMVIEIPRPVPVGTLQMSARALHSGRRSELLEGAITAGGEQVMLARAWRTMSSPADTPRLRPRSLPPALPPAAGEPRMEGAHLDGYISAMEWRFAPGQDFDSSGPGWVWARQRIPLTEGEEDTPLTRALTLVDSNWAVGFELDRFDKLIINTDLVLNLHRDPVGEWLCLRSATVASPDGSGIAEGRLDDREGDCGRVMQTLLIAER